MASGQTAADSRRQHVGEGNRLESRQQEGDGQGEGEGSEQNSRQPWRDTPAGFGSAEERRTAADARSARGSPRQKVSGDADVQPGSKDIISQEEEMLWSEPFLPCSSISAGCLLHESMGVERRAAWYEASLLYEVRSAKLIRSLVPLMSTDFRCFVVRRWCSNGSRWVSCRVR